MIDPGSPSTHKGVLSGLDGSFRWANTLGAGFKLERARRRFTRCSLIVPCARFRSHLTLASGSHSERRRSIV